MVEQESGLQLKGATYKRVESLLQVVRTTSAEDQLFGDYSPIGILVAKLPTTVKDWWDFQAAAQRIECPRENGEAFYNWLEDKGRVGTQARLRNLRVTGRKDLESLEGKWLQGAESATR